MQGFCSNQIDLNYHLVVFSTQYEAVLHEILLHIWNKDPFLQSTRRIKLNPSGKVRIKVRRDDTVLINERKRQYNQYSVKHNRITPVPDLTNAIDISTSIKRESEIPGFLFKKRFPVI